MNKMYNPASTEMLICCTGYKDQKKGASNLLYHYHLPSISVAVMLCIWRQN